MFIYENEVFCSIPVYFLSFMCVKKRSKKNYLMKSLVAVNTNFQVGLIIAWLVGLNEK